LVNHGKGEKPRFKYETINRYIQKVNYTDKELAASGSKSHKYQKMPVQTILRHFVSSRMPELMTLANSQKTTWLLQAGHDGPAIFYRFLQPLL
jgi:hypothetical protein